MQDKYKAHIAEHSSDGDCPLCSKEAVKNFKYWKIIKNDFPYDLIAREHRMIVPLRHIHEDALTVSEVAEFEDLKKTYIDAEYDYMVEATTKNKSIPAHFHLHLIVAK